MASFNELIYDTLELLRGNKVSDDTDLSESQIIYHWNNQRALWLRNEYNKPGRLIDPFLEQDLGCLQLVEADAADCCDIVAGCTLLRTSRKIPKTIELHSGPAITRVGLINKLTVPFSFTNYQKAIYTMNGKYSSKKGVFVFLLNGYMYLVTKDPLVQLLDYINVRGVFENPTELAAFQCDSGTCFSYDDPYPLNNWMIPYIKDQVLQQFGVTLQIPKDATNDAKEDITKQ